MASAEKACGILIITATISPKSGVPNLMRTDPVIRRADYEEAFRFYVANLGNGFDRIVFVGNSLSDITSFQHIAEEMDAADQVEFIVFDGLDYPPSYDRGYGEFKLLDHAMANSRIINTEAGIQTVIWKVTGRYRIANIARIVTTSPARFDLYVNSRNHPRRVTDMYIFGWTAPGYSRYVNGAYQKLKMTPELLAQGITPEEVWRSILDEIPSTEAITRRFTTTPEIVGIRGGDNKGYSTDNRWKYLTRKVTNTVAPWLWI